MAHSGQRAHACSMELQTTLCGAVQPQSVGLTATIDSPMTASLISISLMREDDSYFLNAFIYRKIVIVMMLHFI